MRPLVAVRRAVPFEPRCFWRDAWFSPVLPAVHALGVGSDFPSVESLARVFADDPPVRFVVAAPRPRGARAAPLDPRHLYDARIALDREVPTRERCWHDLMNALVWGTFPRAKLALHTRQHRAITERLPAGARRLPPTRTPELDALALLDEGGVLLPIDRDRGDDGTAGAAVVFGHAIYESLALGVCPAVVAAIALPFRSSDPSPRALDDALASAIDDPAALTSPRALRRVSLGRSRQLGGLLEPDRERG